MYLTNVQKVGKYTFYNLKSFKVSKEEKYGNTNPLFYLWSETNRNRLHLHFWNEKSNNHVFKITNPGNSIYLDWHKGSSI